MFCAPYANVSGLRWRATGPGPDPDVMLESFLNINGTAFRLVALRVPMPRSAGWTDNDFWEDSKSLQADGLLWDEEYFRDFVKEVDAIPEDNRDPIEFEPERTLDEPMGILASAWRNLTLKLGWDGQDWRPAVIRNSSYILIGHPDGPARRKHPGCMLKTGECRISPLSPDRSHQFNIVIEGAVCTLQCAEMRLLRSDGVTVARTMNAGAETWLKAIGDLVAAFPGRNTKTYPSFEIEGQALGGFILPADSQEWSFDIDIFMAAISHGLKRDRMRWAFDMPLSEVDEDTTRMLAALATAVKTRRIVRSGDQAYLACRLDDVPALLGIDPAGGLRKTKSLIYSRLGKTMLRGLGLGSGSPSYYSGRVVERVYIFPDRLYLGLSNAFCHLSDELTSGEIGAASGGGEFLETDFGRDPSEPPAWLDAMPVMVDRQIRDFIAGMR